MRNDVILVADDSPTELRLVVETLRRRGYQTITASDGQEALEKAQNEQPRLAILDIIMPKQNGFQVTRQLKNSAATKDIKIVLLSSKSQDSDRFWGLKQGADDYVAKPFEDEMLLEVVARLY
jgi:twitching motility two-component system response regulator PilH